jgi:hypothetical protein
MTEKTERVAVYVTPKTKTAIEQEANSQDVSQAEWIRSLIHRELKSEQQDRITKTTNAEQRIESLIAEARDATEQVAEEIETATQQYHDLLALNAVYSVGSFRLLGDYGGFSDPQRKAAIESGAARLRDTDLPELDLSALGTADSSARASGSRAKDQGQQPQQPNNGGDDDTGDMDVDDLLDS